MEAPEQLQRIGTASLFLREQDDYQKAGIYTKINDHQIEIEAPAAVSDSSEDRGKAKGGSENRGKRKRKVWLESSIVMSVIINNCLTAAVVQRWSEWQKPRWALRADER